MTNVLVMDRPFRRSCQAGWLACFWCISNQDQVPGFSRIHHFEIFFNSDRIIHLLVVFAMFAALLFMQLI